MSAAEIERTVKLSRATDLGAGETADHVIVRRPTVGEVNAFLDALEAGAEPSLPMMTSPAGRVLQDADLGDMIDDDLFALNEVINGFFPKRLKALMGRASEMFEASSASSQPSSVGTAPTSSPSNGPTPSAGPA